MVDDEREDGHKGFVVLDEAVSSRPRQAVRIIVVEDFAPYRTHVVSLLERNPTFQVISAVADGLQAVMQAEQLNPDVILLDVGLPSLNGIAAARQVSVLVPGARIVFLSQNSDADVVKVGLSDGACGYVLKSDANRELLPALSAILRGKRFVSSGLTSIISDDELQGVRKPFPGDLRNNCA